jgi:predicted Zn-dependent protease
MFDPCSLPSAGRAYRLNAVRGADVGSGLPRGGLARHYLRPPQIVPAGQDVPMSRRLLAGFAFAALVAACATSPTGRRQLMLVSEDQAISSSRQAYVQEMGKYKKEGKLVTDPRVLNRVEVITGRLVAQAIAMRPDSARWEWSVEVIDEPKTVNAWCMAGGRMAIYTGLIQQVDPTDDELAQVMGHEIAHALANHTAERMSVAMAGQAGVLAAGILSDKPMQSMAMAAAAAKLAVELPNSRAAENEADEIGIKLAAEAGYNPNAAVTLWQKMGKAGDGKSPPPFLSTHPSDAQRQQRLGGMVPKVMPFYQQPGARPTHPVRIGAAAV